MSLKISQAVQFLEDVRVKEGDLKIQTLTGFWLRTKPETGERVIVCAIGDAQELKDTNEGSCTHDSTRVDGTLDANCLRCGVGGYWHNGHRHDRVHPSGKVLFILDCENAE